MVRPPWDSGWMGGYMVVPPSVAWAPCWGELKRSGFPSPYNLFALGFAQKKKALHAHVPLVPSARAAGAAGVFGTCLLGNW